MICTIKLCISGAIYTFNKSLLILKENQNLFEYKVAKKP